jgi:hypothetical protein
MLSYSNIISLFLERNILTPQHLVAGSVRVSDASYRNTNFRVECDPGPSYLVKQGVGADKAATVGHEAALYEALQAGGVAQGIAGYLPRFYGYEREHNTLIIELLAGAETLAQRQARTGKFSVALARQVGRALAVLHSIQPQDNPQLYSVLGDSIYAGAPHWILSVHRPYLRNFGLASNANIYTIKIVQRFPEFCALLDNLKGQWIGAGYDEGRTTNDEGPASIPHTPIHCDIKWNNVLVHSQESGNTGPPSTVHRPPSTKLIDWELARVGDPCWDVGSFLGEYLTFWLLSIPVTGQDPPDRFLDLAGYPLDRMRPAIRAFWVAYTRHRRLSDPTLLDAYLLRSVRYAAARLVQTAYEQGQASALLTGNIVVLLQLAFNILQRPAEAALALLGIPLSVRRSGTRDQGLDVRDRL